MLIVSKESCEGEATGLHLAVATVELIVAWWHPKGLAHPLPVWHTLLVMSKRSLERDKTSKQHWKIARRHYWNSMGGTCKMPVTENMLLPGDLTLVEHAYCSQDPKHPCPTTTSHHRPQLHIQICIAYNSTGSSSALRSYLPSPNHSDLKHALQASHSSSNLVTSRFLRR